MSDTPKKYKLKKDKFTKARGGSSKFMLIRCAKCGHAVLLYQKDGSGRLLRMYLDKIHAPAELAGLATTVVSKSDMSGLHCPECGELMAVPMVYAPENRLAFRIIRGAVQVDKSDGTFPLPEGIEEEDDEQGEES